MVEGIKEATHALLQRGSKMRKYRLQTIHHHRSWIRGMFGTVEMERGKGGTQREQQEGQRQGKGSASGGHKLQATIQIEESAKETPPMDKVV